MENEKFLEMTSYGFIIFFTPKNSPFPILHFQNKKMILSNIFLN
jgi:hypothetical protein